MDSYIITTERNKKFLESIQDILVIEIEAAVQDFSYNISGIISMCTIRGLIILLILSEAIWMKVQLVYPS